MGRCHCSFLSPNTNLEPRTPHLPHPGTEHFCCTFRNAEERWGKVNSLMKSDPSLHAPQDSPRRFQSPTGSLIMCCLVRTPPRPWRGRESVGATKLWGRRERKTRQWLENAVAPKALGASVRLGFLSRETLWVSVRTAAGSPGWDSWLDTSHMTLGMFINQSKESTNRNRQPTLKHFIFVLPMSVVCSKCMLEISS